jgi:hypothetical protein
MSFPRTAFGLATLRQAAAPQADPHKVGSTRAAVQMMMAHDAFLSGRIE